MGKIEQYACSRWCSDVEKGKGGAALAACALLEKQGRMLSDGEGRCFAIKAQVQLEVLRGLSGLVLHMG